MERNVFYSGKMKLCLLCAAAVAANFLLNFLIENILSLPLFLDTLFTITVTFLAGTPAGIITAVLTSLTIGLIHRYAFWEFYPYVFCTITEVILVRVFQRGFKTILALPLAEWLSFRGIRLLSALLLLSLVMCVVVSISGGLIAFIVTSLLSLPISKPSANMLFVLSLTRYNIPSLATEILSRIPVNIVDRPVSVFGGYGIALVLMSKYKK
jgi:hypothetical protein